MANRVETQGEHDGQVAVLLTAGDLARIRKLLRDRIEGLSVPVLHAVTKRAEVQAKRDQEKASFVGTLERLNATACGPKRGVRK